MKRLIKLSYVPGMLLAFFPGLVAPVQARSLDCDSPNATLVTSGLSSLFGNTVGPDGALYIAEPEFGTILRFDPQTEQVSTFATGLPIFWPDGFGVVDVEFVGGTAYALVSVVDQFVGGHDIDGIYRMDGPNQWTVIANIGRWARFHPPETEFELPAGVQFALEAYNDGFLVTDGHHNRVYRVSMDGKVRELIDFDDIVPTGLLVRGKSIYMTELGPVPHNPEDGKVIQFSASSPNPVELASGAPMVLDLAFDCAGRLYGLSQGVFPENGFPGEPALPDTGSIVVADANGAFSPVVQPLNQPTSFAIIKNTGTAYVFTLNGEIWKVENLACPCGAR
jgi:hypothetical protein